MQRPEPLCKGKQHVSDDDHVARQGSKEEHEITQIGKNGSCPDEGERERDQPNPLTHWMKRPGRTALASDRSGEACVRLLLHIFASFEQQVATETTHMYQHRYALAERFEEEGTTVSHRVVPIYT